jgi:RNA polymerase sigma-70 factor, ECF subfamily
LIRRASDGVAVSTRPPRRLFKARCSALLSKAVEIRDDARVPTPDDDAARLLDVHRRFGAWIKSRIRRAFPRDWEDVTQDALLKLGRALASQRDLGDAALRALVSRTVRSACVDELRRRVRRPAPASLDAAAADPPDHVASAGERAARSEDVERLRGAAWARLDDRERTILRLRFQEDLAFREIAERLGAPPGSIAGWYSRAVAKLKEMLR